MIVAVAASLEPWRKEKAPPARVRYGAISILLLVFVQILSGALVAKTNAGLTFNTWPLMDGNFIPPMASLLAVTPGWKNLFENVLTVQFEHRMLAYALFALAAWHAFDTGRNTRGSAFGASILLALMTAQTVLGVLTLLWAAPLALALLHQAGAIAVLVAATRHLVKLQI